MFAIGFLDHLYYVWKKCFTIFRIEKQKVDNMYCELLMAYENGFWLFCLCPWYVTVYFTQMIISALLESDKEKFQQYFVCFARGF